MWELVTQSWAGPNKDRPGRAGRQLRQIVTNSRQFLVARLSAGTWESIRNWGPRSNPDVRWKSCPKAVKLSKTRPPVLLSPAENISTASSPAIAGAVLLSLSLARSQQAVVAAAPGLIVTAGTAALPLQLSSPPQ